MWPLPATGDSFSPVTFASSEWLAEFPMMHPWVVGAGGQTPQTRPWR